MNQKAISELNSNDNQLSNDDLLLISKKKNGVLRSFKTTFEKLIEFLKNTFYTKVECEEYFYHKEVINAEFDKYVTISSDQTSLKDDYSLKEETPRPNPILGEKEFIKPIGTRSSNPLISRDKNVVTSCDSDNEIYTTIQFKDRDNNSDLYGFFGTAYGGNGRGYGKKNYQVKFGVTRTYEDEMTSKTTYIPQIRLLVPEISNNILCAYVDFPNVSQMDIPNPGELKTTKLVNRASSTKWTYDNFYPRNETSSKTELDTRFDELSNCINGKFVKYVDICSDINNLPDVNNKVPSTKVMKQAFDELSDLIKTELRNLERIA